MDVRRLEPLGHQPLKEPQNSISLAAAEIFFFVPFILVVVESSACQKKWATKVKKWCLRSRVIFEIPAKIIINC